MFNFEHSLRPFLGHGVPTPAHLAFTGLYIMFFFTHRWAYTVAMRRKLVGIKGQLFWGSGSQAQGGRNPRHELFYDVECARVAETIRPAVKRSQGTNRGRELHRKGSPCNILRALRSQ